MGWKGAIRSYGAAVRRAERESIKKHNELLRRKKAAAKLLEKEQAQLEVETYENLIDRLISVHKVSCENFPWEDLASAAEPELPIRDNLNETIANNKWQNYKPNFIIRLLKLEEKRKNKLFSKVEIARQKDKMIFEKKMYEFSPKHAEWFKEKSLADRILSKNIEAYGEALREINPFKELSDVGSEVVFSFNSNKLVSATINVHGTDIVPKEIKSLLKSGKLTSKAMPAKMFNEIYQDYVCGAVLRVAAETLALLPIEKVVVTATDELLNTATGHLETQAILSVMIPRKTIEKIKLENVDPSDALKNFIVNMEFSAAEGFKPIKPLNIEENIKAS